MKRKPTPDAMAAVSPANGHVCLTLYDPPNSLYLPSDGTRPVKIGKVVEPPDELLDFRPDHMRTVRSVALVTGDMVYADDSEEEEDPEPAVRVGDVLVFPISGGTSKLRYMGQDLYFVPLSHIVCKLSGLGEPAAE